MGKLAAGNLLTCCRLAMDVATCYRLVSDTTGKSPTCFGETGVLDFDLYRAIITYTDKQCVYVGEPCRSKNKLRQKLTTYH